MSKRGGFPGMGGMGGFGGMNINQLMKEAKKMQADIEKSQEELTAKEFEATAGGGAVEVKVSGKIVNTTITTNDDTSLEDAKKLADSVLEEFTDEQKKFFDFQFFIKNEKNENQFPIIGYKQRARGNISWTKDRAES